MEVSGKQRSTRWSILYYTQYSIVYYTILSSIVWYSGLLPVCRRTHLLNPVTDSDLQLYQDETRHMDQLPFLCY